MIYITGDCHGEFAKIRQFCRAMKTTREDTIIILGMQESIFPMVSGTCARSRCWHSFPSLFSAFTATMKCGLPGWYRWTGGAEGWNGRPTD